jgi:acetyl esterase/lipase
MVFTINVCRFIIFYTLWGVNFRYLLPSAIVRAALAVLHPRQLQALLPSGRVAYQRSVQGMTQKHSKSVYSDHIQYDMQELDSGGDSALMWMGNRKKATKVVYFIHGGGFFIPMDRAHFRWCWDMFIMPYADAGINVACAALQYTLSPGQKYPGHLREAAAGFEEIRKQGFSAQDIIIGGDSAGASLTTQLLLHILHPHLEVPAVVLDRPIAGVFLVSPYLTRYAEAMDSYHRNGNFDMVPNGRVGELMPVVIPDEELEEYMCNKESLLTPLDYAPRLCLDSFEKVIKKLNITVGEYEVIADHGRLFAQLVRQQAPLVETVLVEGKREPHDAVVLEYMFSGRGVAAKRLQAFIDSVILGK